MFETLAGGMEGGHKRGQICQSNNPVQTSEWMHPLQTPVLTSPILDRTNRLLSFCHCYENDYRSIPVSTLHATHVTLAAINSEGMAIKYAVLLLAVAGIGVDDR